MFFLEWVEGRGGSKHPISTTMSIVYLTKYDIKSMKIWPLLFSSCLWTGQFSPDRRKSEYINQVGGFDKNKGKKLPECITLDPRE